MYAFQTGKMWGFTHIYQLVMQDFEESNQLKQIRNVVYMFINSQAIFKRK